ncbi:unnamed protein product [Strongylus vulgaris]|uniref:Uncharacterized protein n=1 Tax=Strongylus vulgaris TaxID=40348 RepID=A0A3P7IJG9_STRVU|nr:unnamed protein product [Strongylus vulgaris]
MSKCWIKPTPTMSWNSANVKRFAVGLCYPGPQYSRQPGMDYDPHTPAMSTMYMGQQITHPTPLPMQPPPQQIQQQRTKTILTIQDPNTLEEVDLGARADAAADAKKDEGKGRKDIDETEQKKSEVMRQFTRQLQERNEMDQAETAASATPTPPSTKPNSVSPEPPVEATSSSASAEEQKPLEKESTPEVREDSQQESTPEMKPPESQPAPDEPAPAVESVAEPVAEVTEVAEPVAEPLVEEPKPASPFEEETKAKSSAEEEEADRPSSAATPEIPTETEEASAISEA